MRTKDVETNSHTIQKCSNEFNQQEITFWNTWEKNHKRIFSRCLQLNKQRLHDAQDLLSEVMLKSYTKVIIERKEKIENFDRWILRVLQNTFIDNYRRNSRLVLSANFDLLAAKRHSSDRTFQEVMDNELSWFVKRNIQSLPPRYRHVARLYFIETQAQSDISKRQNLSKENTRKIIQLTKKHIGHGVKQYCKGSNVSPDRSFITAQAQNYEHTVIIRNSTKFYSLLIFSPLSPNRLQQKENSLRKYLEQYPKSYTRLSELAQNLYSQGRFVEALKLLNEMLEDSYFDTGVYELKVSILYFLDQRQECLVTIKEANKTLPKSTLKLDILKHELEGGNSTVYEAFLKNNIDKNPGDAFLREKLITHYDDRNKFSESLQHSETLYRISPDNPQCLTVHVKNLLLLKGRREASDFLKGFRHRRSDSNLTIILLLHFMLSESSHSMKSLSEASKLLRALRRSCPQHPDYPCLKAVFTSIEQHTHAKVVKILKRRLKDQPACALSVKYAQIFGNLTALIAPRSLHPQERKHLDLIKLIHNKK
jgi:RNA polymerase sigma factor (sigma-70 family)